MKMRKSSFLLMGMFVILAQAEDPFTIDTAFTATSNHGQYAYINTIGKDTQLATSFEVASEISFLGFYFQINRIQFRDNTSDTSSAKPYLAIHENADEDGSDVPGNQIVLFNHQKRDYQDGKGWTFDVASGGKLETNKKYWLVFGVREDVGNSDHQVKTAMRHDDGQSGWEIGNGHLRRNRIDGEWANWHPPDNANRSLQFSLNVTPKVSVHADLILSNLSEYEGKYRWTGGKYPTRAASFYTHDNYYGAHYRIRVIVQHYNPYNPDWGQVVDRVWPGTRIYSDAGPGEPEGPKTRIGSFGWWEGDWQSRRYFKRQKEATTMRLYPNRRYWLVFDRAFNSRGIGEEQARTYYLKFFQAKDTRQHSPVGWTIGDNEMYKSGEVFQWANPHNTPPLQFGLRASRYLPDPFEIGDTITPGNLNEANVSFSGNDRNRGINNWRWVATPFYTSSRSGTPPHLFRLDHVTMLNNIRSHSRYNGGNHVIAIYDSARDPNNWWRRFPGEEIGRFSSDLPEIIDGEFEGSISSDNNRQHRFHADPSAPILLKPWTRYWIVQKMENWNSGDSAVTDLGMPSFTRSKNADGWTIGDYYFRTHNRGQNWLEVNETHGAHNDWTMRFGFGATIVSPPQGDINVDDSVDIFDLVLINDHIGYSHSLPRSIFYLGNLNSDSGSSVINDSDRDLLLDLILEK